MKSDGDASMSRTVAKRELLYSLKGSDIRKKFLIRISYPFIVNQDTVNFDIGEGLMGCHIDTEGLEKEYYHDVYGVDEIQAINIASNVDPFLERLSKKYDLFWLSGEPYFDEDEIGSA
jgi:hypothetical protein